MPSISFSIKQENIDYIMNAYTKGYRNKSHWLDALLDHVRNKNVTNEKAAPVKRVKSYPDNLNECFEMVWAAKGRKGSKKKALEKFKTYCINEAEDNVMLFSQMLVLNIEERNKTELGAPEQHLITYLNGAFWDV